MAKSDIATTGAAKSVLDRERLTVRAVSGNVYFLLYLFLPWEDLELHSWHSWNSFISCWFHQNHPHGKREKYHHYKTNDDFPYSIGEKLHTPILFTGINRGQAHDMGFPSLEATLLNAVILDRAEFAAILVLPWQQVGGSPPRARKCWSSRIWWTLVEILPRPCYVGRNGWIQPGLAREPEVKTTWVRFVSNMFWLDVSFFFLFAFSLNSVYFFSANFCSLFCLSV